MNGKRAKRLRSKTYRGTHLRDTKGVYSWRDEKFPSITTLLKVLDKPALAYWAAKSVAEYVADFVNNVVPREKLRWPLIQRHLGDVEEMKSVPWKYAQNRRDIGSSLHDVAERFVLGAQIDASVFSDDLRPLVMAYIDFCQCEKPEFEAIETGVFNRKLGYACTLDAIVKLPRFGEVLCVMDNKTGKDVYPEAIIQVNAQRIGQFIGLADGREIKMPKCEKNLILLIREEGWKLAEAPIIDDIEEIIKSLVTLYSYHQQKYQVTFVEEQEEF